MSEQHKIVEAYLEMVSEARGKNKTPEQMKKEETDELDEGKELTYQIRKDGKPLKKGGKTVEIYGVAKAKKMVDDLNKKHRGSKFTAHHVYKDGDDLDEGKLPPHLSKFFDKKGELKPEVLDRLKKSKKGHEFLMGKDVAPKGYGVKEALDPVDDKANDKKFKNRKDKDIDNDGDVDSSDEYLHKRRAATDDAIDAKKDKKKKPAGNSGEKTPEISKIGETVTTKEDVDALFDALEEAIGQKKDATPPEGIDDKESPKGKEFKSKHKVDMKTHDELEKVEEPKERKVKKEMKEYEVIRALLSGKPDGE